MDPVKKEKLRAAGARARELFLTPSSPIKKKEKKPYRCVLHNKVLAWCKHVQCGGGQALCIKHRIDRKVCKDPDCGGGQALCKKHRILRRSCKDSQCGGGQALCERHRINKRLCKDTLCGGGQDLCEKHRINKAQCKDILCGGGQKICPCGISRYVCIRCSDCGHGNIKSRCSKCPDGGQLLCPTCPKEAPTLVQNRGQQCAACNPNTIHKPKEKELAVTAKLIEYSKSGDIPMFSSTNKPITRGGVCCTRRPDFGYVCENFEIFIEVDEVQHKHVRYNPHEELLRMGELANVCAVPTIIIRFNPDGFKISGMQERVPKDKRYEALVDVLKGHLGTGSSDYLTICYLFFDQPNRMMDGESRAYVRTKRFPTAADYEGYVRGLYPNGCEGRVPGTPWYTLQKSQTGGGCC